MYPKHRISDCPHYVPISQKTIWERMKKKKKKFMVYGSNSNEWAFVMFGFVSSCPQSSVFTAYCTWICQLWGHRVSWNTLATLRQSRDGKRTSEQDGLDWSKKGLKQSSAVEGWWRSQIIREREKESKRARRQSKIVMGEAVLSNTCLADALNLFCTPVFSLTLYFKWKRHLVSTVAVDYF